MILSLEQWASTRGLDPPRRDEPSIDKRVPAPGQYDGPDEDGIDWEQVDKEQERHTNKSVGW